MSLQFIFGASGAGKTEYLYRRLLSEAGKTPSGRFFLLVPEQDTLQTQQNLVGHRENKGKGILNVDVLSFNRLAWRVFEEQDAAALNVIDDMGKIMILRSAAESVKDQLQLYGRQLGRAGFLAELKSQISELYQYRILPEMVALAAEKAPSDYVRAKLSDLALLYQAFRDYMEAHGYVTQEEVLDRLYALLPESHLLDGAVVALDGFSDFTPVQQDIIREVLRRADRVLCTVTLDSAAHAYESKSKEDLFYLSGQTVSRLVKLAKEADTQLLHEIDLNTYDAVSGLARAEGEPLPRFRHAPQLDFLQKNLYRYRGEVCDKTGGIRILEAADQTEEMEAAAALIAARVRGEGLRYRDIGMIVTDVHAYEDIIYEVFSNAGIPYFIDSGKGLLDAPYAEVLRAALEVLDNGFSYESVMRYLRALPPQDAAMADQIDQFDNYLRAQGIRGAARFGETWETFDEQRRLFAMPLLALRDAMSGKGVTVEQRIEALRALLADIRAAEAMEALAARLAEKGDQNRALLYRQDVEKTDEVLERMQRLLGQTAPRLSEFRDILDAGLAEASVTVIPATLDQVVIGDMTRSRFASPKWFFIAGVNADQIPKAETGARIISDRERAIFQELSMELAPTAKEDALLQRFYLCRAMLNPSEELIVSYPMRGRGGKGLKPSALVGELLNMFPQMKTERLRYARRSVYTRREGLRRTAQELSAMSKERALPQDTDFAARLRVLLADAQSAPAARQLLAAAFTHYTGTAIDRRAAEAVYGEILTGSITRLELFNRCAYAHFLKYGLKLAERKNYELKPFDIGNLYHAAIEACFRLAMEDGRELSDLSDEELAALADRCVEEAAAAYGNAVLKDTARSRYLVRKVTGITQTTLWALREQLRRGDFRVHALEREFDLIRDGMRLTGRIDRIDVCEDAGHVYVKVIDYKSGKTKFDLNQIMNGLQLQLAVYMDVALRQIGLRHKGKDTEPAAMFYYGIDDPVLPYDAGRSEDEAALERLRALRTDGLVNTDLEIVKHLDRDIQKESDVIPVSIKNGSVDESKRSVASTRRFQALEQYVHEQIGRYAEEIKAGVIKAAPVRTAADRTACTYCPYHAVCGFDTKIAGYRYRNPAKRKAEEIWKTLLGEEEEEEDANAEVDGGTDAGN